MIQSLPPIQALRAFEAAARHLSYSRAADELGLTHGAISHHISGLEKELGGVQLFVRDGQRMLITDAGQVFVIEVRRGLLLLAEAVEKARTQPQGSGRNKVLAVSVLPGVAQDEPDKGQGMTWPSRNNVFRKRYRLPRSGKLQNVLAIASPWLDSDVVCCVSVTATRPCPI